MRDTRARVIVDEMGACRSQFLERARRYFEKHPTLLSASDGRQLPENAGVEIGPRTKKESFEFSNPRVQKTWSSAGSGCVLGQFPGNNVYYNTCFQFLSNEQRHEQKNFS